MNIIFQGAGWTLEDQEPLVECVEKIFDEITIPAHDYIFEVTERGFRSSNPSIWKGWVEAATASALGDRIYSLAAAVMCLNVADLMTPGEIERAMEALNEA